jgi:hypothetical protein
MSAKASSITRPPQRRSAHRACVSINQFDARLPRLEIAEINAVCVEVRSGNWRSTFVAAAASEIPSPG